MPGTRVNFDGKSYTVHSADCNAVAKSFAFFDALADHDSEPDGYAIAKSLTDSLPDCDCFTDPTPVRRSEAHL